MNYQILGGSAFSYLEATLAPGEGLISEPGAMASMDSNINMKSRLSGKLTPEFAPKIFR